jgi:molybdenum cofactor biosynthesis enzyme MoaA
LQKTVVERPASVRKANRNKSALELLGKAAHNPRLVAKRLRSSVMKAIAPNRVPWPTIIYLGINNRCNYFCEFCDIGLANIKRRRVESDFVYNLMTEGTISFDVWKRFLDDVSKFKPIIAMTTTEPSLYPRLIDMIDYIHFRGMQAWVTTNGFLLPQLADKLVAARLDRLQVSIDGPPEIHNKIRGIENGFQRAMEGIRTTIEKRQDGKPYIAINTVICDLNYDRLVDTLNAVSCDEITFSHLNFVTDEMAKLQNTLHKPYIGTPTSLSRVKLEAIDLDVLHEQMQQLRGHKGKPKVLIGPDLDRGGLEIHYKRHLTPHSYMKVCKAMTSVGQILADGSVTVSTRCLSTVRLGNIKETPFTRIWRGEKFNAFRVYMDKVGLMPACTRCCGAL